MADRVLRVVDSTIRVSVAGGAFVAALAAAGALPFAERAEAAAAVAEPARDLAQQYAADAAMVSGVNVPIYASKGSAAGATIVAGVKSIQTQFYAPSYATPSTLVGGGFYSRISKTALDAKGWSSELVARASFRSVDRFMPDGSTDATNGGYWVLQADTSGSSICQFGAIPDATFDEVTYAITGTDNAASINAAMEFGPSLIPRGMFRFSSMLRIDRNRTGLRGDGYESALVTNTLMHRPLGVAKNRKYVRLTHFRMIGPHDFVSTTHLNRAITFGLDTSNWYNLATAQYDARGCYVDQLDIEGFAAGLQVAFGYGVDGGALRGINNGHTGAAEPGGYFAVLGGTSTIALIDASGGVTTMRHAVYLVSVANRNWITEIIAEGTTLAAVQMRVEEGGGTGNGFGTLRATNCNTSPSVAGGCVHAGPEVDGAVSTATGFRFNRVELTACGGKAVTMNWMIGPDCGEIVVINHTGAWANAEHYLFEAINCTRPRLRRLEATVGFGSGGLNDNTLYPIRLDTCSDPIVESATFVGVANDLAALDGCTSGQLSNINGSGTFDQGVLLNDTFDTTITGLRLAGIYQGAARFSGTSDRNRVLDVDPVNAQASSFFTDASTGTKTNKIWRIVGKDVLAATADTPDVSGYRTVLFTYASTGNLTNMTGGFYGQEVDLQFQNALTTIVHNGAVNTFALRPPAGSTSPGSWAMGTRTRMKVKLHETSYRWIQGG